MSIALQAKVDKLEIEVRDLKQQMADVLQVKENLTQWGEDLRKDIVKTLAERTDRTKEQSDGIRGKGQRGKAKAKV